MNRPLASDKIIPLWDRHYRWVQEGPLARGQYSDGLVAVLWRYKVQDLKTIKSEQRARSLSPTRTSVVLRREGVGSSGIVPARRRRIVSAHPVTVSQFSGRARSGVDGATFFDLSGRLCRSAGAGGSGVARRVNMMWARSVMPSHSAQSSATW